MEKVFSFQTRQDKKYERAVDSESGIGRSRFSGNASRMDCGKEASFFHQSGDVQGDIAGPEEQAWGVILADVARHISDALQSGYGVDSQDTLNAIRERFNSEIDAPTSKATGKFAAAVK